MPHRAFPHTLAMVAGLQFAVPDPSQGGGSALVAVVVWVSVYRRPVNRIRPVNYVPCQSPTGTSLLAPFRDDVMFEQ